MLPRAFPIALVITLAVNVWGFAASAHEFWIEPEKFQVESGAPLVADLRNGQNFSGSSMGYFTKRIARFELIQGADITAVEGRMGDVPALQTTAPGDGLLVILHQTAPTRLTYATWDKFQAFADHKDFPDIHARHQARGLPEEGFSEIYTRFVKALVAVGSGAGADKNQGMETEFVALANPYTDDLAQGLPVQLFYKGLPRGDAQVEVFERDADGLVKIILLRTDAEGRTRIPVAPGHSYLLDAVVLRPAPQGDAEGDTAAWESLWAGLSFAVP